MEDDNVGLTIESLSNYLALLFSNLLLTSKRVTTSGDAFTNIVKNEVLFNEILKKLEHTRIGGIEQYHTDTVSDPKKALSGPVTEVCCAYLIVFQHNLNGTLTLFGATVAILKDPTPQNRETFETHAKMFVELTEGKWTYGWSVEDANTAIIISAWDSIEVRITTWCIAYSDLLDA